jgi:hypothetical protein
MTTSTASTETSVSTLNMAGRGMSSYSMPTSVTAVSTMTPAMTSTGIHWRRNCQKSCHHQRSKRRTEYLLHLTASFLLISLKEAALVPFGTREVRLRGHREIYDCGKLHSELQSLPSLESIEAVKR